MPRCCAGLQRDVSHYHVINNVGIAMEFLARMSGALFGRASRANQCPVLGVSSIGQCNTSCSLLAGVSKAKVFRGR